MAETKKPKNMAEVLAKAKKQADLHVGPMSSISEGVVACSTGNMAIDHIMGVGGLPLGRMIELHGPPSSGKTTTALQAAAWLQRVIIAGGDERLGIGPNDTIAYFDYENALDLEYAKALGLDVDHPTFLFSQPDSLEQGGQVFRDMLEYGTDRPVRMVIWDSLAAMVPQTALDAEVGQSLPAVQARAMSQFLGPLNAMLKQGNCCMVMVNHEKEKMTMGGRPGAPPVTTTPAGTAAKFYASVRVQYKQISSTKGKVYDPLLNENVEMVTATNVRVKVIKNKVAAPFKQAVVRVRFGKGFDNFWTALQVLIAHSKLVYSSGYFYFEKSPELVHPDMKLGTTKTQRPYIQGEQAIFVFADEHPEWAEKVIAAGYDVVATITSALDVVTPNTGAEDDSQDTDEEPDAEAVVAAAVAAAPTATEQTEALEAAAASQGQTPDMLDPAPPVAPKVLAPSAEGKGRVQFVDPAAQFASNA